MSKKKEQPEPAEEAVEQTLAEIGIKTEAQELPKRIDQGDFNLLIPAMREMQRAAEAAAQAQQRAVEANTIHVASQGAVAYIFKHLKPKYQIQDGEDIDSEGNIIRKE